MNMSIFKYIRYIEYRGVIIGASAPQSWFSSLQSKLWTLRLKLMTVGLSQTGGQRRRLWLLGPCDSRNPISMLYVALQGGNHNFRSPPCRAATTAVSCFHRVLLYVMRQIFIFSGLLFDKIKRSKCKLLFFFSCKTYIVSMYHDLKDTLLTRLNSGVHKVRKSRPYGGQKGLWRRKKDNKWFVNCLNSSCKCPERVFANLVLKHESLLLLFFFFKVSLESKSPRNKIPHRTTSS